MFKWLHNYWLNTTNTPSILFKYNLWLYTNSKLFTLKITNTLTYFITSVVTLKQKKIKIFHKNFNFESFYLNNIVNVLFLIVIYLCI